VIHREYRDSVATLRMESGKANAIDVELFEALEERLEEIAAGPARAVVLTGTGSIFCAGVDLRRVVEEGSPYLERLLPRLSATLRRLFTLPLPVVAAVNGHAIAGGCVLAAACDRRVMADGGARIGLSELRVGVPFPVAALEVMRHLLPARRLQEVVCRSLTPFSGEALELGLVDELVPPEELLERARERAAELARIPGEAFALTKRHLRLPAVERIERDGPRIDPEVARIWSRPETLETIRGFLADLAAKGGGGR